MRRPVEHIPLVSLRLVRERDVPYEARTSITTPEAIYRLFRDLIEDLDREAVWMACLATDGRPTCLSQVSLGTLDASMLHPREIMKTALLANARSIILIHNHPSGNPKPSAEDHKVTAKIKAVAEMLGIGFLDHLIIGNGCYYSFQNTGTL